MRKFTKGIIVFSTALMLTGILYSCQSGGVFRSEKRISGKLEGQWSKIDLSPTSGTKKEIWEFSETTLTKSIAYVNGAGSVDSTVVVNTGAFEVETGFSRAFILISDFDEIGDVNLSGKWEIYEIKDDILIIFTKDLGGTITREFTKI